MTDVAVVAVVVVCVLQALVIGVLVVALARQCAASRKDRDFLLWRLRKAEQWLGDLDATVDQWIEAGVNSERKTR